MIAEFDADDPTLCELLRLMREHELGDLGVLGGLLAVAYAADPNGAAVEYIRDGGGSFAAIATRLGWGHEQLLAALVAHLQKTHGKYRVRYQETQGSRSPNVRLH